ncbi:MAG: hypothetical protein IK028_02070 [Bacilli bacterium]|nr:hypothetical protein [Bacilli bacterium]
MKKKSIFVSFAALSLLLSGIAACNQTPAGDPSNSSKAPVATSTSKSSTSKSTPTSTSKAPAVPTPDATQTAVASQQTTPAEDGNGETITWDAQDANKEADGFSSAGKFSSTGSYVKFTFTATMKMKARLYVTMPARNDSVWNRETQSGNQSIWYNWYDGDDWKYNVQVNTIAIDQSKMGTWKVGEVDVPMKELVYADFLADGASKLEAPWFEFDVLEGRNTIRIERNLGYSVNMEAFKVVGTKVTA